MYAVVVLPTTLPITLKVCAYSTFAVVQWLEARMITRLEWSNFDILRAIIVFLDTKNWDISPTGDSMKREQQLMIWKSYDWLLSTYFR